MNGERRCTRTAVNQTSRMTGTAASGACKKQVPFAVFLAILTYRYTVVLVHRRSAFTLGWVMAFSTWAGAAGTTGAPFLNIPVGAGPAAVGSAYSAMADDAYAPVWNPAGLGFLDRTQIAAQHMSYVQSTHYEFASVAVPLRIRKSCEAWWCGPSAVGGSLQYFGSGDISRLDENGNPTGDYSSYYSAYNLSYGKSFGDRFSLGATGKWIHARLDEVSGNAFALDFGSLYQLRRDLRLAVTLMNVGSDLKFVSDGDPLPRSLHVGGVWTPRPTWTASSELVFPRGDSPGFRLGGQWQPMSLVALRTGFRTDSLDGLSPIAAFSMGFGLTVWGHELGYAWVPYGDLGTSHYISMLMRFGESQEAKRNLIRYESPKRQSVKQRSDSEEFPSEYDSLMQLLRDSPPAESAPPKPKPRR